MQWLLDCGLIYKVGRITKPDMPLIAYQDFNAFKLFILDVGLLSAMSSLDIKSLLEGNRVFEEFKGSLTEQYVLQQLLSNKDITPFYWSAEKYAPTHAIRTSMSDYRKEECLTNLPLYAVNMILIILD
jgi:hypothetical protein